MDFSNAPVAICVITRPKLGGVVSHDAILRETISERHVIELHPDHGLQVRRLQEIPTDEEFTVRSIVPAEDLGDANERLARLLQQPPAYDLTSQNCQHFASYVATGRWESRQWEVVKTVGKVAAGALLVGVIIRGLRK